MNLRCGAMILTTLLKPCAAQAAGNARPEFKPMRQDEDWSALRDVSLRTDPLDGLKYMALEADGSSWLTLGGEVRERYEYFRNANWGRGPQDDDGYLLQRFMLHADVHADEHFRIFAQLQSGLESGRNGGPRPPDRDDFELHQLFVEGGNHEFTVRAGRQELLFGSQRLVSVREGPNVRQSFDGVRATWHRRDWQIDAFVTRPVETNPGAWDDGPDPDTRFWGLYATGPFGLLPGGRADFYYLGLRREGATFDQGTGRELRHSLGTRLWGKNADWDWNFEFVYQFGDFGNGHISAWTAASDTGYTFAHAPWTPRLGLKADITSGDRDPSDRDIQTFNPLFPKGAYFGETGLIGPANHIDLHPSIEVHPARAVTLTADADLFWRESSQDGVYNSGLSVARTGANGGSRYVGAQTSAQVEWKIQRHVSWTANAAHFFAGAFLEQNPPGKDVNYFSTWMTFRF
jgi:hypothetical protein